MQIFASSHPPTSPLPWAASGRQRPLLGLLTGLALIAAACGSGGTTDTAAPAAGASAESNSELSPVEQGEANLASLTLGETPFDTEVLNVADGSVATIESLVDGERPVLVWFWAPH